MATPAASTAEVVTRMKYLFDPTSGATGVTMKVGLVAPDGDGAALICTQVAKLSAARETCSDPLHAPSAVFVVSGCAGLLKVTEMLALRATPVAASTGFVEDTASTTSHTPLPHTLPEPQFVPLGALPLSVHTGAPEEQTMAAVWQGSVEVQVWPALQEVQAWSGSQTMFVPQLVPAGWKVRSVHTGKPDLQSTFAVASQGLVDEQSAP